MCHFKIIMDLVTWEKEQCSSSWWKHIGIMWEIHEETKSTIDHYWTQTFFFSSPRCSLSRVWHCSFLDASLLNHIKQIALSIIEPLLNIMFLFFIVYVWLQWRLIQALPILITVDCFVKQFFFSLHSEIVYTCYFYMDLQN